jgi:hypothetical protein
MLTRVGENSRYGMHKRSSYRSASEPNSSSKAWQPTTISPTGITRFAKLEALPAPSWRRLIRLLPLRSTQRSSIFTTGSRFAEMQARADLRLPPCPPDEGPPPTPRRKLEGRAFYESLGSPKLILAPMVDRSEFVGDSACLFILGLRLIHAL